MGETGNEAILTAEAILHLVNFIPLLPRLLPQLPFRITVAMVTGDNIPLEKVIFGCFSSYDLISWHGINISGT